MRKVLMSALIMALAFSMLNAGNDGKNNGKLDLATYVRVAEPVQTEKNDRGNYPVMKFLGTSVLVDSMINAYTTQGSFSNQIGNFPTGDKVAIIHRGDPSYGSTSGRMHYNYSTNLVTWFRTPAINEAAPDQRGRHPSIWVFNDGTVTNCAGMWGELVPGASWGYLVEWSDLEYGAGLFTIDYQGAETKYGVPHAPFGYGNKIFYGIDHVSGAGWYLVYSTDGGQTWSGKDSYFLTSGTDYDSLNGTFGDFAPDNLTGVFAFQASPLSYTGYIFGYRKTTDGGNTWLPVEWVTYENITGLPPHVNTLMFQNGVTLDASGNIYFIGTFYNRFAGQPTDPRVIMLSNRTGSWVAYEVAPVQNLAFGLPGGLATRNECRLARSADGTVIAAKYIDGTVDTAGVMAQSDMYFRFFNATSGTWFGPPINATTTVDNRIKFSKLAPRLVFKNNAHHAYAIWTLFGNNDQNDLTKSYIYFVQERHDNVSVPDGNNVITNFNLKQNYPNPFNPTTTIAYDIKGTHNVTLKVYNAMGQEVRTLVNARQNAGSYKVQWDGKDNAGKAVASGVYLYRLEAGNVKLTKKMMFMK